MAPSKVSFPKTAKEALEWSLHYIVESGHDSTFPEEFGLDFGLTDVAMLDPKKIEEEGLKSPAYVGLDLETSLDGLIRDAQVWQYSRMVHLWLYQTPNKKLKAEVEELMDYELKAFGVDTQGEKMTFSTKAGTLSRQRQKRIADAYGSPNKKAKFIKRGKENEFEVHLEYLMGGHSGSSRKIILYFTYSTSFIYFLRALQDATQLCTIPPIDFLNPPSSGSSDPIPYYPGYPRSSGKLGSKDRDRSMPDSASEEGNSTETWGPDELCLDLAAPSMTARPRGLSARGYTLKDGPWTCRRFSTSISGGQSYGANLELMEEAEYLEMVESLKEANNADMGVKHSLSVMHSMEYSSKRSWLAHAKQEERANQRTKNSLLDDLQNRTAEEAEADDIGMKRILDNLGIKEFTDEEIEEFGEGWMEMWNRKNGSGGGL